MPNIFDYIYRDRCWINGRVPDDENPLSGPGSGNSNTENLRRAVIETIDKYNIKTVLDVGCGDCEWTRGKFPTHYVGMDISEQIIEINRIRYPEQIFIVADAANAEIPKSDLIILRDILQHNTYTEARTIYEKCLAHCRYLLVSHSSKPEPGDIERGQTRRISLTAFGASPITIYNDKPRAPEEYAQLWLCKGQIQKT